MHRAGILCGIKLLRGIGILCETELLRGTETFGCRSARPQAGNGI
ncbi:hypothetical protein GCWU000341_01972 [Oribacterium sp. oral taxon 078 str. F0262]|nr:hypothetical protein GCWU000341_01972 [Oribacterium sp. oral taxon 078 str. F0262]